MFGALALVAGLSGCAQGDALSLAKKACVHVELSLSIYNSARRDPGSPRSAAMETEAVQQLRVALPIAASAAGDSSQWQALMTTLGESTRLPESYLVSALQSQCAAVDLNG